MNATKIVMDATITEPRAVPGRPGLAVGTDSEEAMGLPRNLTHLDREARFVDAECGVYDRPLGFCFGAGTLAEGGCIRAPLFPAPRRLSLTTGAGTHSSVDPIDDPRGVNVNRTLLLALQKCANVSPDGRSLGAAQEFGGVQQGADVGPVGPSSDEAR